MSIGEVQNYSYGYDTYGRLNQIATPAGTFTYTRLAESDLLSQLTRPNGVNTTWSYEPHRNLIAEVANGSISTFGYTNNAIGNRTAMSRSGSAFTAPDTLNYQYNSRSEVTGANSTVNEAYTYAYAYDPIGNRLTANESGTPYTYTSNVLNQYTAINTDAPTYDADGNMLTNGAWSYTWNGENRLIQAVNGTAKLQFAYDYTGRRIEKKVFEGEALTKHNRFVYNNYKQAEELDATNANAVQKRYTWQPDSLGLDVPLALTDVTNDAVYTYTTDANKNVTDLYDATGTPVSHYQYSPFGTQTTATGDYAQANPFRFSSEFFDQETELVYYNYRYYDSEMGRWLSKDPIEEKGGSNLYGFVFNNPQNFIDKQGTEAICTSIVVGGIWIIISKVAVAVTTLYTTYVITEEITETVQNYALSACMCLAVGVPYAISRTRTRTETEPKDPCVEARAICHLSCWNSASNIYGADRFPIYRRCMHNCMEAAGCSY